jgi:hypothetical protein
METAMSIPAWLCVALTGLSGLWTIYRPIVDGKRLDFIEVTAGLILMVLAAWAVSVTF